MNKEEFRKSLLKIKSVASITGKATYIIVRVDNNYVEFKRNEKPEIEKIAISDLYNFYLNENEYTTPIAKTYISGRRQSPAVAILKKISSNRISTVVKKIEKDFEKGAKVETEKDVELIDGNSLKDEDKFFIALAMLIGEEYIKSKSIKKPISSSDLFLSNNYLKYEFSEDVKECYNKILNKLKSSKLFSSASLAHNVDGLIVDHPVLKNRIVEFDEEQHFTPARKDCLIELRNILQDTYLSKSIELCNNLDYLKNIVLKKHRISYDQEIIPSTFKEFAQWLDKSGVNESGYISSKNGFEYLGGRIAQRAYYDCLRDTAHLSPKNSSLHPPLRFAKKWFEDMENQDFKNIPIKTLLKLINEVLIDQYNLTLCVVNSTSN